MTKSFMVLSIDGGGVRGIFPATILALIEEKLNIKVHDTFDLIVGTSTGAIIAGAIATKYELNQLGEDYSEQASIFFKKRVSLCGLLRSRYSINKLEEFLREKLGDIKLGQIDKPLILNATNISTGDVHVFKSSYQKKQRGKDYVRDGEVPLYKAVLASCAAPLYFDPVSINGTLICDGGIWANNPSLVGYTDVKRNFQADNIKILSLGTGKADRVYKPAKCWGFINGWQKTKLMDMIVSCQTQVPQNVLDLVNDGEILRINKEIENFALDNYKKIHTMKEMAKSVFTKRSKEIENFLSEGDNNHET